MPDFTDDFGTSIAYIILFGAIASYIGGAIKSFYLRINSIESDHAKTKSLDDRIELLSKKLKDSNALVHEIEFEIDFRKSFVKELELEADKYVNLISLNQKQVDAVTKLLQTELKKEGNSSFWKGVSVNFIFFVLGAGVSWYLSKGM